MRGCIRSCTLGILIMYLTHTTCAVEMGYGLNGFVSSDFVTSEDGASGSGRSEGQRRGLLSPIQPPKRCLQE